MRQSETRAKTLQSTLADGLDRYSVACAAVAAVAAMAGHAERAEAAIVYSGAKNLNIGYGGPGQLYVGLTSGQVTTGNNPFAGWDINPFISSPNFFLYTPVKNELVSTGAAGTGDIGKLTAGTTVSSASPFVNYTGGFMNNNSGVGAWSGAGTGYVGFQISHAGVNNGNPVYGWIQVSKAGSGTPTSDPTGINIVDWAYQDNGTAIAAGDTGAVPEPSCLALLAAGALGLMVRRGRARPSAA